MDLTPNVRLAINDIDSHRADFLKYRANHIGSSDIAAIAGLDRWKTPLDVWAEKTGRIPPKEDNDTLWYGRKLEPIIGELFTRRTGLKVTHPNQVWQSNIHPWASMSPDFLVSGGPEAEDKGAWGILETKAPRSYQKDEWGESEAPDAAHIQLMWQLGLSGYQHGFCGAIIGGNVNDAYFPRFLYEKGIFEQLLQIAEKFYREHIIADRPPEPSGDDTAICKKIFGCTGGSITLGPDAEDLFLKWEELERVRKKYKENLDDIEKEREKVKNEFRILFGGASSGIFRSWVATFKEIPVKGFQIAARTDVRFSVKRVKDE